jgi:hypothetical protein
MVWQWTSLGQPSLWQWSTCVSRDTTTGDPGRFLTCFAILTLALVIAQFFHTDRREFFHHARIEN